MIGGMGGGMPPPPSSVPSNEFGPSQATTAPPQPPPPSAMRSVQLVTSMVTAARQLADDFPELTPEVRQINDIIQKMQLKLVRSLPPSEVPAPPI